MSALPEVSGENDWRRRGRGGRAADFNASSTSGEETMHMCGLRDTGSVRGISGSTGDEMRAGEDRRVID